MGNQNQKNSIFFKEKIFESERTLIVDLDYLIRRSIVEDWRKTSKKKVSSVKNEDLQIVIDWKQISFKQDSILFSNCSTVHVPRSQLLVRTQFENQTNNEQIFNFRSERSTLSTFRCSLTEALFKSKETPFVFRLPDTISSSAIGVPREHSILFGRDLTTTKEYETVWPVDTQIRVASRSRASVELFIDEDEFQADFLLPIRISGRLTGTIFDGKWPQHCLKSFSKDLVSIYRSISKNDPSLNDFEIRDGRIPSMNFNLRGKCSFRYGIKQNLTIRQESLDSSSMYFNERTFAPLASTDYSCLTTFNSSSHENGKHLAQL